MGWDGVQEGLGRLPEPGLGSRGPGPGTRILSDCGMRDGMADVPAHFLIRCPTLGFLSVCH